MAGWHRRVRREHDLRRDAAQRLPRINAFDLHALPDHFERRKGAVAFVQVQDARRDAHRAERAHPADAEQQLLADAYALVAAVEARGQLAVLRLVAFDVRIEQQQRAAADRQLPDARHDGPGPCLDGHDHGHAVYERRPDRQLTVIERQVVFVLPAVDVEPLPEVALVVVEPDADERDAEVRRALDVVARQDAEAARVDGQRLVNAELRGEIGDGPRPQHAGMARAPRPPRLQVLQHPAVTVVDAAVQRQLRRPFLDLLDRHLLEQRHGVAVELPPQHRIELPE